MPACQVRMWQFSLVLLHVYSKGDKNNVLNKNIIPYIAVNTWARLNLLLICWYMTYFCLKGYICEQQLDNKYLLYLWKNYWKTNSTSVCLQVAPTIHIHFKFYCTCRNLYKWHSTIYISDMQHNKRWKSHANSS